jgi:hypothetical protein
VYRATDTRLHRTVASKILPRDNNVSPRRGSSARFSDGSRPAAGVQALGRSAPGSVTVPRAARAAVDRDGQIRVVLQHGHAAARTLGQSSRRFGPGRAGP